jgi:magnesium transporter
LIHVRLFRPDERPQDISLADCEAVSTHPASLVWADVEAPTDAELAEVGRVFNLDPLAVQMLRRSTDRSTVRAYESHYVVTALSVDHEAQPPAAGLSVVELDLVLGRWFLVSCHQRPLPFAEELEERTMTNVRLRRAESAYLLYLVLDTLIAHHARELDEVEDRVEHLEEQLLGEAGRGALTEAALLKRHVQLLRRIIAPHRETFGALVAADVPWIVQEGLELYFRDLQSHLAGNIQRLDHMRDAVTGSYNLYISNMSFRLSDLSYRTNEQLKVLTFLSAVLLPMTVITGLFGTNFTLAEYNSAVPFYVMLAGMGVMSVALLVFFRWRGWL